MNEKVEKCKKCGEVLPLSYFKKYSKITDGRYYHALCRSCENEELISENWKDGLLKCHICGEYFPEESFQKHNNYSYRNNRDKRCGKCKSKQNKKARENYSDEQKLDKIILTRFLEAKARAEKKQIDFDLTIDFLKELFFKQKQQCDISKIKMTYELDSGRINTNLSLDRIDSSKGYTKDNIHLVCMAINQMKSDLDIETLLYFCKEIIKNNS